jgi:hypothetical protein
MRNLLAPVIALALVACGAPQDPSNPDAGPDPRVPAECPGNTLPPADRIASLTWDGCTACFLDTESGRDYCEAQAESIGRVGELVDGHCTLNVAGGLTPEQAYRRRQFLNSWPLHGCPHRGIDQDIAAQVRGPIPE